MRMVFEDWLPDPLAVATWIEKSLITARPAGGRAESLSSRTRLDMRLLFRGEPKRSAGRPMISNRRVSEASGRRG
jgi:hypothetical protein